jgi:Cu/Ag efflux pump CusA
VAAAIGARDLTLGAIIAFFSLTGLTLYHGVTIVRRYRHLERDEGLGFEPGLVVRGSRETFPAVAISTLATMAVLLPFVVRGALPGLEIVGPLAVVLVGARFR